MVVDGGLAPDVCLIHQHVSSSFRVGRFEVAGGRVFRVCRVEILTRCQMPRHGQKPPLPPVREHVAREPTGGHSAGAPSAPGTTRCCCCWSALSRSSPAACGLLSVKATEKVD